MPAQMKIRWLFNCEKARQKLAHAYAKLIPESHATVLAVEPVNFTAPRHQAILVLPRDDDYPVSLETT